MIRTAEPADAAALCSIYNYYVRERAVTFEETPVTVEEMEGRVAGIGAAYPFFTSWEGGELRGFAYANKWRDRSAYRFSAEATVYLKRGLEGRGLGTELFGHLIGALKETELHALISAVTVPNERSAALHRKFGFKRIAVFNEVGFKLGKWLDVEYWELLL
ncbi:MAG: GNAT family N-acetyltransferase [Treponema sp.]|nr:GNAT family N-acetyltransferase [Treponema sp.]